MPEKETYHDQVQVHPFHHAAHSGVPSAAYPLQFPSAFVAFHSPLSAGSIDQRPHDTRYLWDPSGPAPPPPFHHHPSAHGFQHCIYPTDIQKLI